MRITHSLTITLFFVILGLFCGPAKSQDKVEAASGEDVAMAFYIAAQAKPDFDIWARESEAFKYQPVTEVRSYLQGEKLRLEHKWNEMQKDDSLLTVRTRTPVVIEADMRKKETDPDSYTMAILPEQGTLLFFPYMYAGKHFAVIPSDVENILLHRINRETALALTKVIEQDDAKSVTIDFTIRPATAYTDKPYKIGKEEQWVLMGDVVSVSIVPEDGGLPIWQDIANWYITPKGRELREIYHTKTAIDKAKTVK
jgi:hypothetical protein